jgi:hypothetical protein
MFLHDEYHAIEYARLVSIWFDELAPSVGWAALTPLALAAKSALLQCNKLDTALQQEGVHIGFES